jgi:hypothetical protein
MDAMTPCTHENEHVSKVYQVFAKVFLSRQWSSCDDRNVIFKWYPIFAQLLYAVISRYMALLMHMKTYNYITLSVYGVGPSLANLYRQTPAGETSIVCIVRDRSSDSDNHKIISSCAVW